jgi:hypothetical protein
MPWETSPSGKTYLLQHNGTIRKCQAPQTADKTKNLKHFCFRFLAERWGFEPQNAFDTLHDFQSCALDQLSHLSTSSVLPLGGCPWRSTIIPESRLFVKDFFEKNQTFLKMTKKREKVFCRMDGKHKKPLTHL